jgi:hypothetical protein
MYDDMMEGDAAVVDGASAPRTASSRAMPRMAKMRAAPAMTKMRAPPPPPGEAGRGAGGSLGEEILNADAPDAQFKAPEGRMLIKTASLDLEIAVPWVDPGAGRRSPVTPALKRTESRGLDLGPSLSEAEAAVRGTVESNGGYIESASTHVTRNVGPTKLRQTRLSLRVPSERFDESLSALASLVEPKRVRSRSSSSRDVTEDFVDRAARHKALLASHAQLLLLMKRAGKVQAVLEVQRELRRVAQDIESQAARLASLQKRARDSTINLTLVERMEDPPPPPKPPEAGWVERLAGRIGRALKDARRVWGALGGAFVDCAVMGATVVLPAGLLLRFLWPLAAPMGARCAREVGSVLRRSAAVGRTDVEMS